MADAHQAFGHDMQQEAADKFRALQGHRRVTLCAVVLDGKFDLIPLERNQALVTDGDPVRVARQVANHLFAMVETGLAVHCPVLAHQLIENTIHFPRTGDTREFAFFIASSEGAHHFTPVHA